MTTNVTSLSVRLLGSGDESVLDRVADGVFDHAIRREWLSEFLNDSRHCLVVAIDDGWVVGFASGVHCLHPDKAPQLWVNEVGVAPTHQNRGIARRILAVLFEHARTLGCHQAWVATERNNAPARRLYAAVGGEEEPDDVVVVNFHWNEPSKGNEQAGS